MTQRIINADVLAGLRSLADASVHCVVTSPPYWGLRDYGLPRVVWDDPGGGCEHEWGEEQHIKAGNHEGWEWTDGDYHGNPSKKRNIEASQGAFCRRCNAWRGSLGLEPTPELYAAHIVQVFREVRRVLRDDGTLWCNLGDAYAHGKPGGGSVFDNGRTDGRQTYEADKARGREKIATISPGLKPKDLIGMPWRVALALQVDGWWLRSDIIWAKPNPMPESVTDRPTKAHEYLFLLTKAARYYYDAEGIKEPSTDPESLAGYSRSVASDGLEDSGDNGYDGHRTRMGIKRLKTSGQAYPFRNCRSVWTIPTQAFPEAHFATFPEKLVEPCILAGTSAKGCCPKCGAPWMRVVEKDRPPTRATVSAGPYGEHGKLGTQRWDEPIQVTTTGWRPSCEHGGEPVPAVVLDPFFGAGTTGLVATRLGRGFVGIDLSAKYVAMAKRRIADACGLLAPGLRVEGMRHEVQDMAIDGGGTPTTQGVGSGQDRPGRNNKATKPLPE